MKKVLIMWIGQLVSQFGTGLTKFGISVWVYETTGSTLSFAVTLCAAAIPGAILSPIAGVVVDRIDRRLLLVGTDLIAVIGTAALLAAQHWFSLQIWYIYIFLAVMSSAGTFQVPAFKALIPMMVSGKELEKINGMQKFGQGFKKIAAPAVAGTLFTMWGLGSLLLIDIITFSAGILPLLVMSLPQLDRSDDQKVTISHIVSELVRVSKFIVARKPLVYALGLVTWTAFLVQFLQATFQPLVLDLSSAAHLGKIISISGAASLASGLILGVLGGPDNRGRAVGIGMAVIALGVALIGARPGFRRSRLPVRS
ncbi:MAG: MFS transporter [Bradymonadaceae bacterium]